MKKSISILVLLISVNGFCQQTVDQKEIMGAIRNAANHIVTAVLDKSGKSRCDYHIIQGEWFDYEPAWHTGQLIYALVEAYRLTEDEIYLESAKKAGDWWTGLQITDNPALNGMVEAVHGDDVPYICFATVTDGTAGLFQLYKETGIEKYARVPTEAGEWMLNHMYVEDERIFYDLVDRNNGELITEWTPFWPEKDDPQLYDLARPNNEGSLFKDMYEYSGSKKYKTVFVELCESLVEKQDQYGLWMDFMPNDKESGYFHPRFNMWYAESLLEGYELTGKKAYLQAALKTARFYTKFQKGDGTFYYKNYVSGKSNRKSICGSIVSFSGIVWLRLLQQGVGDEFKDEIEKSLRWVLTNRYPADHADENLAGGMFEERTRFRKGMVWMVYRDIADAFGIRFLSDYYRYLQTQ